MRALFRTDNACRVFARSAERAGEERGGSGEGSEAASGG